MRAVKDCKMNGILAATFCYFFYIRNLFSFCNTAVPPDCIAKSNLVGLPADYNTMDEIVGVRNSYMIDKHGRVQIFHGFSSVKKGPPWYHEEMLNATRLSIYKEYGFNVVRLGVMWSGIEPEQNHYNDTYITILKSIINKLHQNEIYVILDMHQDVLSSRFGMYDGIPLWLLDKLPPSPNPYPWPLTESPIGLHWADGYMSQAAGNAFQHIYNNYSGALDLLGTFWVKVAEEFKDVGNVLGYDLMNEPWAGDIYSNPSLLLPGAAGRQNIMPMYDKLNDAIRKVDDKKLIFYEPTTWGVIFKGNVTGSGFDHVPGGDHYQNRSVLSYHYYCYILEMEPANRTYPLMEKMACDAILAPKVFDTIDSDVHRTGGGVFLTEFGLCVPDGLEDSVNTQECEAVLEEADKHMHSWTYWDSQFFYENGSTNRYAQEVFSRPYPRSTAGQPHHADFNRKTGVYMFTYQGNSTIIQNTVIFIPPVHYPNGISVDIKSSLHLDYKYEASNKELEIFYTNNTGPSLAVVEVCISRA